MRTDPDRFAVFRHTGFARYWLALILTGFALQMQTVAVGWQVYAVTGDPFDLGLIGLSQFAPALALVLVTGTVSDRYSRRLILGICLALMAGCAGALLVLSIKGFSVVWPVFVILAIFGGARAFYNPARQSIIPNLVPKPELSRAIAVVSTGQQVSTIGGPAVGGLLFGLAPEAAYGATLVALVAAAVLFLSIPQPRQIKSGKSVDWQTLNAGFRYIWSEKVVLGAISLDLFAVLLGGAVALLPVYAADILQVGPTGLGFLRAAQAVGAIFMGAWLVFRPVRDHAGQTMLATVVVFGLLTLVFALSETLWLSVLALVGMGAADMISVNIRQSLVQIWTPDDLRGRVNAVNQVFVGASNEVGGFRAGTMAVLIGPVAAVAVGAAGTVAVAGAWAVLFPEMRRIRSLVR
ncbi:MFS transporter [Marivita sp.]|uniref:MFS transporter n=1 Tax=Marivita sp. TaxID=2003365 RepID=UPI003F702DB2